MPHDEHLAERLQELLAGEPDLTEQRMFGGVAFLLAAGGARRGFVVPFRGCRSAHR